MPRPQRFCIFCGSPGLTGEHIWADWLKNYIPREMESYSKASSIIHADRTVAHVKKQGGDPHSRKVKVVCGGCNSGWMSQLQERAKPILIPLINGQPTVLDLKKQAIISAWVSMAMIVADLVDPDKSAVSTADHKYFYEKQMAPLNWAIWIGDYERDLWKGHMVHNVMALSDAEHIPEVDEDGVARQNTNASTFVVKRLFIHVISSQISSFARRVRLKSPGTPKLRKIWYANAAPIKWPPPTLNDVEADGVARDFFERARAQLLKK